jgi:hypothetical protein
MFPNRFGPDPGEPKVGPPRGGEEATVKTTENVALPCPKAYGSSSRSGAGAEHLAKASRKPSRGHEGDVGAGAHPTVESPDINDQPDGPRRLKTVVYSENAVDDSRSSGPGGDHVVPHHAGVENTELFLANPDGRRSIESLRAISVVPLQILRIPPELKQRRAVVDDGAATLRACFP